MEDTFNFNENTIKSEINHKYGLIKKISASFQYLEGKFKKNKVTKTLKNLITYESKNCTYFFIEDGSATILVRQYGGNFIIYTRNVSEDSSDWYAQNHNVFTLEEKEYSDDKLENLKIALPQIMKLVKDNEVHTMWNSLCFEKPENSEVRLVYTNGVVDSLDFLILACGEICQKYAEIFAENEMFEKIKTLKKGDPFGSVSIIHDVVTDLKDGYYHGVGVFTTRIDEFGMKHEKEPKWSDVYSLCYFHYSKVFPETEKKV